MPFTLITGKPKENWKYVIWQKQLLEHSSSPKYLGVKLDRTLLFKEQCNDTINKLVTRNSLLRKLVHSKWGAQPSTLRTSSMTICLSADEYAAPVWQNLTHTDQVDVSINEMMRIITRCLKPTPLEEVLTDQSNLTDPTSVSFNWQFKLSALTVREWPA